MGRICTMVFDVKTQAESNTVTYSSFKMVTHKDGPSYLLVDRTARVQADSVDLLFQALERHIDENVQKFGPAIGLAPSVLLKNADLKHSGKLIFGY